MTKGILKFNIPTINDGHEDFLELIKLNESICNAQKIYSSDEFNFQFSFSNCGFLRQNAIAYLGAISTFLKEKGFVVLYAFGTMDKSILKMLEKDGFLSSNFGNKFSNSNTVSADAVKFTSFRGDLNKIEGLSTEIVKYIQQEWLKDNLISITPILKGDLSAKMYELFANALEHSGSPVGCFACGQSYSEDHEIVLTIVDLGIGIVNSVKRYFKKQNQDIKSDQAIQWAMQSGNTTRFDDTGGLGLSLIYDFLKLNNGTMDIYCNGVFLRVDQGKMKVVELKREFSGTMINIRMRKRNVRYGYQNEFKG